MTPGILHPEPRRRGGVRALTMRPRLLALAALAAAAGPAVALRPAPLAAQVATVDEGSFTITRRGERVGREEFTIRRTPGAQGQPVFVSSATVAMGEQRLAPALRSDSLGAPLAYALEVRAGAAMQEQLKGAVGRGRFSTVTRTPRGESAREFMIADGALVIDDGIFHQYYFVARSAAARELPVVIPRRNAQLLLQVADGGAETLTIGGRPIEARRWTLREPGGAVRQLWADARGRVLKVELPGEGVVALRDDPPR